MKTFRISAIYITLIIIFLSSISVFSQVKTTFFKSPRYNITVILGYDYAFSNANGDVNGYSTFGNQYGSLFTARNYGMQHGGNIAVTGEMAVDKRRQLRATGTLGYTLFYNSEDGGMNRTKWSIFTLGAGVKYFLRKSGNSKPFVSFEADYNLIFGAWQTDVTFPDNTMSNIYIKFWPESRLGISIGSGAEFKINRKTTFVAGVKGIWANIAPKSNNYTVSGYDANLNDSKSSNGISFGSSKQMIYMQVFSGITFNLF
jgi:hypothetical protein